MKTKRRTDWLLSLFMVFLLLMGTSKMEVYAAEYTVDFGTGSWTVGNTTVTTDKSGQQTLSDSDVISLTNFDAETMEVKLGAEDGFSTTLTVTNNETSLSAKNCDGLPNGTLTFSVAAKSADGGGGSATYTVDFGIGSWTVGNTTVTTDKNGQQTLLDSDVISLTNFDAETMEVRLTGNESGFTTTLTVTGNQTSLSAKNCDGLPNETMTFSVAAKSAGEGEGEGNSGDLQNPIEINVNITSGTEYLDFNGVNIRIDGTDVQNGSVTVEQAENHVISVLPQFGYAISTEINGNSVSGTEVEGWMNYTVSHADAYNIAISVSGNSVYTVVWDYVGDFGDDALVSNGTVRITSAVMPDGSNGIGIMNDQTSEGGHVVIEPGSTVTVEIKPAYGYQFVKGSLNGVEISAGEDVSIFTFVMAEANLHLSALFTEAEDIINTDSTQVQAGSIAGGANVVDSGNLKLEIGDLSQSEIDAVDDEMKQTAGDDEIQLYLDLDLYSVVNKGTQDAAWENQLTDLNGDLSVTLELSDELKGTDGTFYVIREHEEADGSKTYNKIQATYNKAAGTVTFTTNKFSTYALVLESEADFSDVTDPVNNACNADLSELTDDLINKLLTDAEKTRLENGEEVKVWLEATDISASVSQTDKDLIDSKKGNATIGMYLDIDLLKQIGSDNPVNITETDGAVTITLNVPSSLINSNSSVTRTYQLIRVHDGVATVIPCTYNATNQTISCESDQFSTYALAYVDQQNNSGGGNTGGGGTGNTGGGNTSGGGTGNTGDGNTGDGGTGNTNSGSSTDGSNNNVKDEVPKTGDASNTYVWFIFALVSGIGALYFGKKGLVLKGKLNET